MFKPNGSLWVIVPEGEKAENYLGKGVRYTVDEVVREASDKHFRMVRAKTLEVFAESAEGTLKEISDTEAVVDVILRSSGPDKHKEETMRFAITPDTIIQTSGGVNIYVNVLYDVDMNALYVIQVNG